MAMLDTIREDITHNLPAWKADMEAWGITELDLTVGFNEYDEPAYQTGDNQFMGPAYHHRELWVTTTITQETTVESLANEIHSEWLAG